MRFIVLMWSGLLIAQTVFAQNFHRCGYDQMVQHYEQEYPGFNQAREATFQQAKQLAGINSNLKSNFPQDSIYKIPVVVHIVYKNSTENLHDSLIYNQIEMLNQSYRMQNPDTSSLRAQFDTLKADAGIEFFLAKEDPQGDSTTGIIRKSTSTQTFFDFGDLDIIKQASQGGSDAWDPSKYLNIWVGDLSFSGQPGVLGFAYPPIGAANWPAGSSASAPELDGVVVHFEVFGDRNPLAVGGILSIADRGRTAVHEVGHFLGLRHIWGDGGSPFLPGPPDCSVDDGISDTPNSGNNSQQTGCDVSKNTCSPSSGYDYPDLWENYMDYSREECQVMFTKEQVAVMRSNLFNFRNGLIAEGKRQTQSEEPQDSTQDSTSVSIYQVDLAQEIKIYPNPTQGIVNLKLPELDQKMQLKVLAIDGQVIRTHTIGASIQNYQLNLNDLSSGMYFIQLQQSDFQIVKKIIIE